MSRAIIENFNLKRINKELTRIYGIHNINVVKTVLKEASAPDLLEELKGSLKGLEIMYADSGLREKLDKFNGLSDMIKNCKQAIEKATE